MTDLRYRQKQLRSLQAWLTSHVDEWIAAERQDGHVSEREAKIVVAAILNEVRKHYDSLNLERELADEYSIKHGRDCADARVAAGIVYIVPEQTMPMFGALNALSAAIAAGNCCAVEVRLYHSEPYDAEYALISGG